MKESENNEIQLTNLDDIIIEKENNFENNDDDTNKIIEHVESFNTI